MLGQWEHAAAATCERKQAASVRQGKADMRPGGARANKLAVVRQSNMNAEETTDLHSTDSCACSCACSVWATPARSSSLQATDGALLDALPFKNLVLHVHAE
jgi:hypothetical protein